MTRVSPVRSAALYLAPIALGLLAWELAARNASRLIMAPPSEIGLKLWQGFASGALLQACLGSLAHMIVGLAIAVAIALLLGVLIGRSRTASNLLEPIIAALYAIPPVAFVPILVIWAGLFFEARVTLVVLMTVFEMLFAFAAGARNVPPPLIDVARSFGAGRVAVFRTIVLPAMLPFVFTGLRLGTVRAVHGMIVAELFFHAVNLGAAMKREAARFDSAGVFAIIVVLAVFGLVVQETLRVLEWRLFANRRAA